MTVFEPRNPDFAARVHRSFNRQTFMSTLGAELNMVKPGAVDIRLKHAPANCQQHGYFHGGVVGTLADNASGYASFSLMEANDSVLTVEYKLNLFAPADGDVLLVKGRVVRAGRQLIICRSDAFIIKAGVEKQCAAMLGTFMVMKDVPESHHNISNVGKA
jgi:uncharacterized protein (TIGR00369 family)